MRRFLSYISILLLSVTYSPFFDNQAHGHMIQSSYLGPGNIYSMTYANGAFYLVGTVYNGFNDSEGFVYRLSSDMTTIEAEYRLEDADFKSIIHANGKLYVSGTVHDAVDTIITASGADTSISQHADCNGLCTEILILALPYNLEHVDYGTYLGGQRNETVTQMAFHNYSIYILGNTQSSDFPTSNTSFDNSIYLSDNNQQDGFIVSLQSDLSSIQAMGFIGDSCIDSASSMLIDGSTIYVVGDSQQCTFEDFAHSLLTGGKCSSEDGNQWGFITSINDTLTTVIKTQGCHGITFKKIIKDQDSFIIAAHSQREYWPPQTNVFGPTPTSTQTEILLAKIDQDLTHVNAYTYYGSSGIDSISALAQDSQAYYMIGTSDYEVPYVTNSYWHQSDIRWKYNGFAAKLSKDFSQLYASALVDGMGATYFNDLQLFDGNSLCIVGASEGNNYPVTPGVINPIRQITMTNYYENGVISCFHTNLTSDLFANPASVDFGSHSDSITDSATIVVASDSPYPLPIKQVQLRCVNPSGCDGFAVTYDGCSGHILNNQDSCSVEVAFSPHKPWYRDAELLTIYDGSSNAGQTFPLYLPDEQGYAFGNYWTYLTGSIGILRIPLHAYADLDETMEPSWSWPMLGGNPQRNGQSSFSGPVIPKISWEYNFDYPPSTPAIGHNGTIYITSGSGIFDYTDRGFLHALSPEGQLIWEAELAGSVVNSVPAIAKDGSLYVLSHAASHSEYQTITLHHFSDGGSLLWALETNGDWGYELSSPLISPDGMIIYGDSVGGVYAAQPEGWAMLLYAPEVTTISNPVALDTDLGQLWISIITGVFRYDMVNRHGYTQRAFQLTQDILPPIIGDHVTYQAFTNDGGSQTLYAIDQDGTYLWGYPTKYDFSGVPAIGTDGTIYQLVRTEGLHAINPAGQLQWVNHDCYAEYTNLYQLTVGIDGTIYCGSCAISQAGETQWCLTDASPTGPVIHENGLLLSTTEGALTAFSESQPPYFTIDATSFDFGTLQLGPELYQHSVTVTASPLISISSMDVAVQYQGDAGFTINSSHCILNESIEPTCSITIAFRGDEIGNWDGQVIFSYHDQQELVHLKIETIAEEQEEQPDQDPYNGDNDYMEPSNSETNTGGCSCNHTTSISWSWLLYLFALYIHRTLQRKNIKNL